MKQLLINTSLFLALTFTSFMVNGQAAGTPGRQFKGSIQPGPGANQVSVYFTPDYTASSQYFTNLNICLTIPTSATTPAPKAVPTFAVTATPIPSFTAATWTGTSAIGPEQIGANTVWTFVPFSANTTTYAFTAGTPFLVATFSIDGGINTSIVTLADYSASGGGASSYSAFYVELNADGQVSNATPASMFYTTGTGSAITSDGSGTYVSSSTAVALPVTLIDFTAAKSSEACAINLKWQVSAEVNFKNYEVQRSTITNGLNYTTIATIAAQGVSNYASTDKSPVSGTNYYRLKMNDNDGHFTYSKIIPVNSNCNGAIIQVWPNPAISSVNVTGLTGKNSLAVLDAIGKQVATFSTTNIFQKIDMSKFSRGNYSILITGADGSVTTLKLVKL